MSNRSSGAEPSFRLHHRTSGRKLATP